MCGTFRQTFVLLKPVVRVNVKLYLQQLWWYDDVESFRHFIFVYFLICIFYINCGSQATLKWNNLYLCPPKSLVLGLIIRKPCLSHIYYNQMVRAGRQMVSWQGSIPFLLLSTSDSWNFSEQGCTGRGKGESLRGRMGQGKGKINGAGHGGAKKVHTSTDLWVRQIFIGQHWIFFCICLPNFNGL